MSQEEPNAAESASTPEAHEAGERAAAVAEGSEGEASLQGSSSSASDAASAAKEREEGEGRGEGSAAEEERAGPPDSAAAYKQALDCYLHGPLRRALEIVDEILAREPDTELKPRLERLRRRAQERLAKEPESDSEDSESAAGVAEPPSTELAATADAAPGPAEEPPRAADGS
ncbi:MAG: hypothetical protein D6731_15770, partial [Planctomycetota bacterium]